MPVRRVLQRSQITNPPVFGGYKIFSTSGNVSPDVPVKRENLKPKNCKVMNIRKHNKGLAVGLAALAYAVYPAMCADTINQSGTSGTTFTGIDQAQGSGNALRPINFATIANDANNLYITLAVNPAGNLATGGSFNYVIGITSGNPSAGGDTSANATTHGNAYSRDISFDSGFGGMQDFIGIFGAGATGANGKPQPIRLPASDLTITPGVARLGRKTIRWPAASRCPASPRPAFRTRLP